MKRLILSLLSHVAFCSIVFGQTVYTSRSRS